MWQRNCPVCSQRLQKKDSAETFPCSCGKYIWKGERCPCDFLAQVAARLQLAARLSRTLCRKLIGVVFSDVRVSALSRPLYLAPAKPRAFRRITHDGSQLRISPIRFCLPASSLTYRDEPGIGNQEESRYAGLSIQRNDARLCEVRTLPKGDSP
jgi:hypothetical protein